MKTLACGEIMPGCAQTFAAETDDAILAQAGQHAATVHGLDVTPEIVATVRGLIRDTADPRETPGDRG